MLSRGAYTTIGMCVKKKKKKKNPHLNGVSYHSHTYRHWICKAVQYIPLGSIDFAFCAFCIVLTTLNKRAYARCEMYAQLPGVKPTNVPDWRTLREHTHSCMNPFASFTLAAVDYKSAWGGYVMKVPQSKCALLYLSSGSRASKSALGIWENSSKISW